MQRGVCMCKKNQINQNRHTQKKEEVWTLVDTDRCTGKLKNLSEICWLA